MIGVALPVVFADAKKHAEAGTDAADRLAGDVNFGAGYSLDDGSHDELALEESDFFQFVHRPDRCAAVKVDDLLSSTVLICGNKEIHC